MFLSIIIPTLNEEQVIKQTLLNIKENSDIDDYEIILADGGSTDQTLVIAREHCHKIIQARPGRGWQMATAASEADGDVLLFVHADTRLPAGFDSLIDDEIKRRKLWGRFNIKLSGQHPWFRVIETMINIRTRLTSLATGDQCIFVSRQLYEQSGGFDSIPVMEDIELSKKLARYSKPAVIKRKVLTSSRRWEKHGIMQTILLMWLMRFLYFVGVSPQYLGKLYK